MGENIFDEQKCRICGCYWVEEDLCSECARGIYKEKIYYTKGKYISEECEIEIEDIKNCFLKGKDEDYNRTVYFGIWQNSSGGVIATLEDRKIIFDYSRYGLSGTTVPIKKFLKNNNNVEKISRKIFFNKLEKVKELISE